MDEWYYQRGETTFGPITGVMMHNLVQRGRLLGSSRVRRSDAAEWSTVAQIRPDLPPVPEAAPPSPEQPSSAQPFDSSLPGASVAYAPPQSGLLALPQTRLPAVLWFGFILCTGALLFEIACWISMIFIHYSGLSGGAAWPQGLQLFAVRLKDFVSHDQALTSSIVGTITVVIWQGCAFASLRHLYGGLVRRSLASGLWWLVPIASFFKPLLCLRDMRYLSRTRRDVPHPQASFGLLLITLEAFILLCFSINVFAMFDSSSHRAAINQVQNFAIIGIDVTLLVLVITNFLQQRRLYTHWDDDAHWQNSSSQWQDVDRL
ncbi:GYF domain-containing protein [Prosthecobacter sp.]|uniref:GYF domain-containing protein n=1 Tax=Prosthecobacter sp. TaxID=1965333 RepID=UPI002487E940|nr:GYF domain-containing protein [Prosthecobacter sp.]MDI1312662.1 GYF domain-containing protein [Prosthecobacter sp.]